jgi:hypothetical protein
MTKDSSSLPYVTGDIRGLVPSGSIVCMLSDVSIGWIFRVDEALPVGRGSVIGECVD